MPLPPGNAHRPRLEAIRHRGRWRGIARTVVLAGFVGAVVWALMARWEAVAPALGRISPVSLGAALGAVLAGILATFLCWRTILGDLGGRLPVPAGARLFFLAQLGKYLPGSLWPVMTQMELGRDHQIPERASGAAVGVFLLVVVATGLAVAAATAPLLGPDAVHAYWWLLAGLPLTILVTVPPVLNRLVGLAMRLARRPPLPVPMTARGLLAAAGWSLASWLAYGVHIWVLAGELGGAGGLPLLARATGAFAAAWCAGFLMLLAPAGAGVREAALMLLLAGVLSGPQATVVVVVSRLLFVIGDIGWCATALLARTTKMNS
jgi:glycosyltransferase 2 family protein